MGRDITDDGTANSPNARFTFSHSCRSCLRRGTPRYRSVEIAPAGSTSMTDDHDEETPRETFHHDPIGHAEARGG